VGLEAFGAHTIQLC